MIVHVVSAGSNDACVSLASLSSTHQGKHWTPNHMPASVHRVLYRLIKEPTIWWVGQMLQYLLRPNEETKKKLSAQTSIVQGWGKVMVG